MVKNCCVFTCRNTKNNSPSLSFYRIPSDPERKQQWIEVLRNVDPVKEKDWSPTSIYT